MTSTIDACRDDVVPVGRVRVCCRTIPARLDAERERSIVSSLGREELETVRSMPHSKRVSFLCGRELARLMIQRIAGIEPARIAIRGPRGHKPRVEGVPNLDISISHSGDKVCVALGEIAKVGIDIETVAATPWRTVERFFSFSEAEWLRSLPPTKTLHAYRALWSIKEALAKVDGAGLRFPLPALPVPLGASGRSGETAWRTFAWRDVPVAVASTG